MENVIDEETFNKIKTKNTYAYIRVTDKQDDKKSQKLKLEKFLSNAKPSNSLSDSEELEAVKALTNFYLAKDNIKQ